MNDTGTNGPQTNSIGIEIEIGIEKGYGGTDKELDTGENWISWL